MAGPLSEERLECRPRGGDIRGGRIAALLGAAFSARVANLTLLEERFLWPLSLLGSGGRSDLALLLALRDSDWVVRPAPLVFAAP